MVENVAKEIRKFVVTNFLFGQDNAKLTDEASFLETGVIDSTGVLELVAFVEQTYQVVIADKELLPENLDSIRNVSRFVARKREAIGAGIAG